MERCSLMGCSLEGNPNCYEQKLPNGLVRGHAYSVTGVKKVNIKTPSGKEGWIQLVRIRNPWGNECEWKGAWGDSSPEWQCISQSDRNAMGLTFDADGEFWMAFADFTKNFEKLEICNLGPEASEAVAGNLKASKHWENQGFEGAWVRALLQKHRRKLKKQGLGDLLTIGYAIYHIDDANRLTHTLDKEFFRTHVSCARSPNFINLREVTSRFRLPAGNYAIVPSTFDKESVVNDGL